MFSHEKKVLKYQTTIAWLKIQACNILLKQTNSPHHSEYILAHVEAEEQYRFTSSIQLPSDRCSQFTSWQIVILTI